MVQKKTVQTRLPHSFLLSAVIIRKDENSKLSDITRWCGYDVLCDIEITISNAITGHVLVTFPQRYDEMMPVFVLVVHNVTINGVEN